MRGGGDILKTVFCILYPFWGACFFACLFCDIIWKTSEIFVPLQCQREKTKFAAQAGDKNYRARRQLLPRQSQKRSPIGDMRK